MTLTTRFPCYCKLIAFLFIFCSAALPGHAWADDALTFELSGQITARCEVTYVEGMDALIEMSAETSREIRFGVDCNLPMTIQLTSENGGMGYQNENSVSVTDEQRLVPYNAALSIESVGLQLTTDSSAMRAGVQADTGEVVPFEADGQLSVELLGNAARLPAGQYADEITITVSPSFDETGT